jgi:hypothetical protein
VDSKKRNCGVSTAISWLNTFIHLPVKYSKEHGTGENQEILKDPKSLPIQLMYQQYKKQAAVISAVANE